MRFASLERKRASLFKVEKSRAASGYAKTERKTEPREGRHSGDGKCKKSIREKRNVFLLSFSPDKYLNEGETRTQNPCAGMKNGNSTLGNRR